MPAWGCRAGNRPTSAPATPSRAGSAASTDPPRPLAPLVLRARSSRGKARSIRSRPLRRWRSSRGPGSARGLPPRGGDRRHAELYEWWRGKTWCSMAYSYAKESWRRLNVDILIVESCCEGSFLPWDQASEGPEERRARGGLPFSHPRPKLRFDKPTKWFCISPNIPPCSTIRCV